MQCDQQAIFGVIVPEIPKYFLNHNLMDYFSTRIHLYSFFLPRKHKVVIVFLFIRIKS